MQSKSWNSARRFFLPFLALIIITVVSAILDIPIVRQFSSFALLTFIPGWLIILALRLDKLGWTEKIALSVGLSVSFVMLFGVILNYTLPVFGYLTPLSLPSLLISFSIAIFLLAVLAYLRNRNVSISLPMLNLSITEKALLVVPSLFPLLSIVGMRVMNVTDNNSILMLLLFLIPAYVVLLSVCQRKVSERLYPAFTYLIGTSLVFLVALRSNHLIGSDIHEAYYSFQTVLGQQNWSVSEPSLVNSLLSISLLPSIYQVFLNIDSEYLFKLLFSGIVSVLPIAVYVTAKKYLGSFHAFLACFFFMSQFPFLWTAALAQTNMAILFFALAIMVWFQDNINEFARRLLFLLFSMTIVVSHYSASFVFLFVMLLSWIGMKMMLWFHRCWRKQISVSPIVTLPQVRSSVSMTVIILLFAFVFLWYAQVSVYPFDTVVSLLSRTFGNLQDMFLVDVKGPEVLGAFNQSDLVTIPQKIRFLFAWVTVFFIAIGGLSIAGMYKRTISFADSNPTKATFLESRFELEYFALSAASAVILVAAVVLPYVSQVYSMERTYFQMIVVLSPFFVLGGIVIARWWGLRPYLPVLAVILPFFMCVTGTMYQLFDVPASLILNSTGTEYVGYISDERSYAAKWLSHNGEGETIHTDSGQGPRVLASQGGIPTQAVRGSLGLDSRNRTDIVGYIYLFYPAVVKGDAPLSSFVKMDIVPMPELLGSRIRIFTSGTVEIYR